MAAPTTHKERVWLYIRLTIGAGFVGIAWGYYMQAIGRLEMDGFLVFSYTVRGMIIGAFFWYFEVFWVHGPRGAKLRALAYGPRLLLKVVVYVILIEAGFLIGYAVFNPQESLQLLMTGNR